MFGRPQEAVLVRVIVAGRRLLASLALSSGFTGAVAFRWEPLYHVHSAVSAPLERQSVDRRPVANSFLNTQFATWRPCVRATRSEFRRIRSLPRQPPFQDLLRGIALLP